MAEWLNCLEISFKCIKSFEIRPPLIFAILEPNRPLKFSRFSPTQMIQMFVYWNEKIIFDTIRIEKSPKNKKLASLRCYGE